jgi:hypothetical protein
VFETDNPLLERFWRRQFRLRWLHQSTVVWSSVFVLCLLVVIQWDFTQGMRRSAMWEIIAGASMALVSPIATLLALSQMSRSFHRLRFQGRLEELLITRLTGRDLSRGFVIPAITGQWILWIGLTVILIGTFFDLPANAPGPSGHPEVVGYLLLMGLYGLVQSLYAATITLRLSMALPRLYAAQLAAVGILVVLPVTLCCLCGYAMSSGPGGMDEGSFALLIFLLICLKLAIAVGLTAAIREDFHGQCRLAGE